MEKKFLILALSLMMILQGTGQIVYADSVDGSNLSDETLNKVYEGGITSSGATEDSIGNKIPLSADYSSEVFDNGDGTFSYYVVSNTNLKQPGFMGNTYPDPSKYEKGDLIYADKNQFQLNYEPMLDTNKFWDVNLWVNPEVEVISAEVINSDNNDASTVTIEDNAGQKVVKWHRDNGSDIKVMFLNDPDSPFMKWIGISPLHTIKVIVKPKSNISGKILPFKSVTGTANLTVSPIDPTNVVEAHDKAYLRSFIVNKKPELSISTAFYDKNFTKEIEKVTKGEKVGVKYVISNISKEDIINFVQKLNLTNVTIDGVASDNLEADKTIQFNEMENTDTITIQGNMFANSNIEAIGTASVDYKESTNITPETHVLGSGKYFRYRPEEKIDSDDVFPAQEGEDIDVEEKPFVSNWIYGYGDRSENGYQPGINAFDTKYIYNGTNTIKNLKEKVTDNATLRVKGVSKKDNTIDNKKSAKKDNTIDNKKLTKRDNNTENPKTSDNNNIVVYLLMLLGSLFVLGIKKLIK